MPRSYSYDHFQNPKRDTTLIHHQEKTAYTEAKPSPGDAKIHYGHAHAETEEILIAKQMNSQLEELAGLKKDEARAPEAAPKKQEAAAELPKAPELPKSAPIGALPVTEEPATWMPQGLLTEVSEVASAKIRTVRSAASELIGATWNLAKLPADLAAIAARHLRPNRA